MKIIRNSAFIALSVCMGLSACVDQDPPSDDPPDTATVTSGLDCNPAVQGCIDTAIRDGNLFLIDTCIAVLCR